MMTQLTFHGIFLWHARPRMLTKNGALKSLLELMLGTVSDPQTILITSTHDPTLGQKTKRDRRKLKLGDRSAHA